MNHNYHYQLLKPEDVIEVDPPTVAPHVGVMEAITHMNHQDRENFRRYSYVLIVEKARLVGILTEPDIVRLTAAGIDLVQTRIDEVMTTKLITLKKSEFLDTYTILTILRQNQIRHLPIVDDGGKLEGMVTVHTICQALHPSNLLKFRCVDEAMTTEVLQAPMTASIVGLSQIMTENRASCVVIIDCQRPKSLTKLINQDICELLSIPIGIVTERDIVQFHILGIDLVNTTAQTVMSTPLVCMKTKDSLMQVRQQMEKLRVRRLVITGEQGELRGIINQFNMLKVLDPAELFSVIETLQKELDERTNQLQQEKELAQVTLQSIGDAVITTDVVGKIVNLNPMAEQLTGWKINEVQGNFLSDIFNIINEYTREPVTNPVEQVLRENKVFGLANHTILIARNGTEYAIEDSAAPIHNLQGQIIGAVIVFRNVTESRNLAHQLSWQATHDALTGLYNRREFEARLLEAIFSAQNEEYQHIFCYLDLDRFKIVNDTCGHIAGDELLRQVTQLMIQKIRASDSLARLGGDEFGFLLNQCSLEVGIKIANNFRQSIEDFRFTWQDQIFTIGVSIGLVEINCHTENLSTLLNAADVACYAAKAHGRNCINVYQDNDIELSKSLGEKQWIVKLNQALAEDRFCLYYQEIASIKGEVKCNYYEILLRLCNEQGQLISPDVFIPAAERYNIMPAIDRWVINNFLANYEVYCQQNINQKTAQSTSLFSINLSGTSINSKQFRAFLKEKFTRFPIYLSTVCFEITETAAISNLATAATFIQELKQLGCSIALDDFGSGMSSLTYLKNLSVDYLKIDGSFVKNIVKDKVNRVTVEYFNHIAQIMNIKTVAEFVENEAILKQLQEIGVDYAQGYGISQPRPLISCPVK